MFNLKVLQINFSFLILLILLFSVSLFGQTTFYISSSGGNDSNNGTSPSTPWKTLDKLHFSWNSIQPGDNILLKRGDTFAPSSIPNSPGSPYSRIGIIDIPNGKSGTPGNYITIGAYDNGEKPIISGANLNVYYASIKSSSLKYMVIQDLEIRGGLLFRAKDNITIGVQHLKLLRLYLNTCVIGFYNPYRPSRHPLPNVAAPLNNIEIGWCELRNTPGEDAINLGSAGDSLWIHHNKFFNVSEEAIDIGGGGGHIIEYNFVSGTTANGIKLHSQFSHFHDGIVRGNVILHAGGQYQNGGNGLALQNASNCKVYNNTIFSGYSANLGEADLHPCTQEPWISLVGSRTYYGKFENNEIRNNIFDGTIQITGSRNNIIDSIWYKCVFSNNVFNTTLIASGPLVRFWDNDGLPSPSGNGYGNGQWVIDQRNIYANNFATQWNAKAIAGGGGNEIASSQLFVSPYWTNAFNYGDFHLQSGSPALTSGYIIPEYLFDIEGNQIPVGSPPDRGAYQTSPAGPDLTPPEVTAAEAINAATVIVTFSELVSSSQASNPANYSIDNGISVSSAVVTGIGNQVTLTTSAHATNTYTVVVSNIEDLSGNIISPSANSAQYTFIGDEIPPEVESAEIMSSNTVKVFFSESVNSLQAADPANYNISNGVIVNNASVSNSATYATLSTSDHTPGDYSIQVENIEDLSGNVISPTANSYGYHYYGYENYVKLPIAEATASASYQNYTPDKAIDGLLGANDPNSRWAALPMPQWIMLDLGAEMVIGKTRISFYKWNEGRVYQYSIQVSSDLSNWEEVITDASSDVEEWTTTLFESRSSRYIKVICLSSTGNAGNYANLWEVEIWGENTAPPPADLTKLSIIQAIASDSFENFTPDKAFDGFGCFDGDPDSRWAALPMSQWIMFDLGVEKLVSLTKFSFFNWDQGRIYQYSVLLSNDSTNWVEVVTNASSASVEWSVNQFEPLSARYIKMISLSSTNNPYSWANLWEAEVWGFESAEYVNLNAKVCLEGPYSNSSMNTTLNSSGILPLHQPYNNSLWNYYGPEMVSSVPTDVVDWILLELRTGVEAASKVSSRAAFLKNDGTIVELNGSSQVIFLGIPEGDYYVVVRHRNHLPIMSASPVSLLESGSLLYDYSSSSGKAYGSDAMVDLQDGCWGMISGDVNKSGDFDAADIAIVQEAIITGPTGYLMEDNNLTGDVSYIDFARVQIGILNGYATQFPE